jgi:hypothetical protein
MIEVIYDSLGVAVAEMVRSPILYYGQVICGDWWFIRSYGIFPLGLAAGTYNELRQRINALHD